MRNGVKKKLLQRLAAGAGTALLATAAVSTTPAHAIPRPITAPTVQRDEIRTRLGLDEPSSTRAVPEGLAWWGNWTNGGPQTDWNNWPNWNNWQDWPDWPNLWNNWHNWQNWGNM